ncbi:hypothetical protein D3C81_1247720 [compost metagenome]
MQRFHFTQGTANVIQIILENTRADANGARTEAQDCLDGIPMFHHEIRFCRAERFKYLVGPGCHIHEQRFFTSALKVIRVAQHDHRSGFDVAQIGIEQLEFAHHRRVTQGEQGGFELFTSGALGHDVEAWLYRLRTVVTQRHRRARRWRVAGGS